MREIEILNWAPMICCFYYKHSFVDLEIGDKIMVGDKEGFVEEILEDNGNLFALIVLKQKVNYTTLLELEIEISHIIF